jgi:hypothetical protein
MTAQHLHSLKSSLVFGFCVLSAGSFGYSQQPELGHETPQPKLALRAVLVLSPKFCATKKRQSVAVFDVLFIGKAACAALPAALGEVFSDLRKVDNVPIAGAGAGQIILVPKFVDVNATQPLFGSSERNLVVLLEWTVQDTGGKTVWLKTVQGSSRHKLGWVITKNSQKALTDTAIGELARSSAVSLSTAPEIRKLAP